MANEVKQSQGLDFNNLIRVINLPNSIANGQPVTHAQIQNFLSVVSVLAPLTGNGTSGNALGIDFSTMTAGQVTALLTKLNILAGAEPNVNADWNASSGDAQILNKPTIPTLNNTLASTSTTQALTAAQGKVLNDKINGLGDVVVVADNTARDALTGLDVGDIVHVIDAGSSKWEKWQITTAGTGAWASATKVLYASQEAYEGAVGGTDLSVQRQILRIDLFSSTGANTSIDAATTSLAGLLVPADKQKLDSIGNATTTIAGLLEIATQTEVNSGSSNTRAITPQTLANSVWAVKAPHTQNIGNGSATSFNVNHTRDTLNPTVLLKENSNGQYWAHQPTIVDANNITLNFSFTPTSNQFTVIVKA